MIKIFAYCLIFILIYPIDIQSSDITCNDTNSISNSKENDVYCQNIIDGYVSILQSQEERYSNRIIDQKAIKYMNDVTKKIIYWENQCNIKNKEIKPSEILLSTKT